MGFEDDYSYSEDFETDIADPDNMDSGEQPKKLSRKELREAKKRNAEKNAELPKQKRGLLGRHERLDDNDETLTDEHIFDPSRSAMISTPRDRGSRDAGKTPIRNSDSEFSYLFDPVDDDESEDDVYPESSIYSDSHSARELLAGLSFDGSDDGGSGNYESYFEEHSEPPESKFSFKKKNKAKDRQPEADNSFDEPEPPKSVPVKVTPKKAASSDDDLFLPEMRPDSVFAPQPKPEPKPAPAPAPVQEPKPAPPPAPVQEQEPAQAQSYDPPLPPLPDQAEERLRYEDSYYSYDKYDDPDEDEIYMNNDQGRDTQTYTPYGGLYPSYPMSPMNQMMPYPLLIPNTNQNQPGGNSIQTIPIPYPMPMPMPMPMYGQYPSYPPQYPSYPPQYPYPQQEPYGRSQYEGRREPVRKERRFIRRRRREDRYDDRRDERYDNPRDDRYDDRRDGRYDDRRRDRYDDRDDYYDRRGDRYDDRDDYYDRRRDRYDDRRYYADRREGRYDDRRGDRFYRQGERRRESYPQPPYAPPYRDPQEDPQPVLEFRRHESAPPAAPAPVPQPVPEPIQAAAPEPAPLSYTPSPFVNTDFSFHKPPQESRNEKAAFEKEDVSGSTPPNSGFETAGFDEFSSGGGFENDGADRPSPQTDGFENTGFESEGAGEGSSVADSPENDPFGPSSFADDPFADDSFGDDSFGDDSFGDDSFGDDSFGDALFGNSDSGDAADEAEEDDFGLGFGGRSISSDRPRFTDYSDNKPSGSRFKKRK
ncbi:MAG: hypothetical protein IJM51_02125 [Clostridia bacterium]|nr:hypothetical protein [Clostridia bacterium]